MSVANEIQRIINAKTSIKNAIENKGVEVGSGTIDTYAEKIEQISSGGVEVTKGLRIDSYDANGYVAEGTFIGTEIPNYYFYHTSYRQDNLLGKAKINLPNTLTKIGDNAFYECQYNTFSELPNSLTSVGSYAFYYCKKLNVTKIPAGVTYINSYAFNLCTGITELTFEGDVTYISANAFKGSKLAKMVFPNNTSVPYISSGSLESTPIHNGSGFVYVPDNLLDEWKATGVWASKYANYIKGISELA